MKDKIFVILGALAASIIVNWWEDYRRSGVSPEAHFWHDLMVQSYKTAEGIGRLGMLAEKHYREEVSKVNGGR